MEEITIQSDKDNYIVILNIDKYYNVNNEKLISMIIHEMFHIHQLEKVISRREIISKGNFIDSDILELENLKKIYYNKDYQKLVNLIKKQKEYRKIYYEDLEGTALYAEYKYLLRYTKIGKNYPEILINEIKRERIELIPYVKGLFICLILDDLNKNWQDIYNNTGLLIHQIMEKTLNQETKQFKI